MARPAPAPATEASPPRRSRAGAVERPELPDSVLMPLLERIVRQSLDEDYEVVARRKAADEATRRRVRRLRRQGRKPPPGAVVPPVKVVPPGRPRRVAAGVIAVFGLLVATAAVQTSRNAPEQSAGRASLISQIQDRRTQVARLQSKLVRLRTSTTEQRTALAQTTADQQVLAARIERLEVRTGFTAVTGPGVRITVDDAPGGDVTQVVRDSDLAILVDGLWNAGAEAISVNGKRLTALAAFRNVGPAIHIGITPLVPPYTILVIGDPDTLAANLLDSTHGQEWYALKDSLGFVYQIEQADSLSVPAARLRRLRSVREPTADTDVTRPGELGASEGPAP
jgi:uncharacterized protein YlxW (UPF0749 family)